MEPTPACARAHGAPTDALIDAVQANCAVVDAAAAAEAPLCIYLLRMRELFRWERGIALGAALPRDAVGAWLAEREAHWAALAGAALQPLPLDGACFDPFDADGVNARLARHRLHYGAGLVAPGRPLFFVAACERVELRDGATVVHCGREFARGVMAPPAALSGGAIVVRHDAALRWLWETFETWALRRADGPMRELAAAYGLDGDDAARADGLARLQREQADTLVLHELGELRAGASLGARWAALRAAAANRRSDALLRALRDNLADCLVTLPALAARGDAAALHFWFANFDGQRARLFPSLAAAYRAWRAGGGDGMAAIGTAAAAGAAHFERIAHAALALHDGQTSQPRRLAAALDALLDAPSAAL